MGFIRNQLPNFLTCLNLLCGLSGLILLNEQGINAFPALSLLVFLAGTADFLDGFVARMLGSVSAIGKDLDSLADAVTFGVLPGMAFYLAMQQNGAGSLSWLALAIPLFSVIRLARFNNDASQSATFKGVPTPANAFFLLFFLDAHFFGHGWVSQLRLDATTLSMVVLISSWLLLSPFRMLAFKFSAYSWKANLEKYLLLATGILLMALLQKDSAPLIYILYLLLSFLFTFRSRKYKPL